MDQVVGATPVIFDPTDILDVSVTRICGALFTATDAATVADTYDVPGAMHRSVCSKTAS